MNIKSRLITLLAVIVLVFSLGVNPTRTRGFVSSVSFFKPHLAEIKGKEDEIENARFRYYYPFVANGIRQNPPADPIGPIGGTFTSVLTDPNSPNIVYGGHFQKGVFKSYDQGKTWYEKNKGLPNRNIQSLAIHPRHSNILYVGTYGNGVYLSRDGGDNWIPWSGGVLDNHIIYDIEIDRLNPSNVYIASRISSSLVGYLARSTDAGKTWKIVYRGDWFGTPDYFYDVAVHPAGINTVYLAAHEHGFYRSENNGLNYSAINYGVSDLSARGFAFSKSNPNLVMGSVWKGSGVFRSWNKGSAWQQVRNGLPEAVRIIKIKGDPFSLNSDRFFVTTFGKGLYSSSNLGDNWVYRGLDGYFINDIALSFFEPNTWFLATKDKGMLKTRDAGASWSAIMRDLRMYAVTGMQSLENDSDVVYVSLYGQGVYRVRDNKDDWQAINNGLDTLNITGLYQHNEQLWASTDSGLWVLNQNKWRAIDLPVSKNADEKILTWQNDLLGIPLETLKENFIISFENSISYGLARSITVTKLISDGSSLLIASDDGIWKLDNDRWTQIGLADQLVYDVAIETDGKGMWASTCDVVLNCAVWHYDGAEWVKQSSGLSNHKVNDLTFIGKQLFAASDSGLYIWQADLSEWSLVFEDLKGIFTIHQATDDPRIIIAGGKGALYKSEDFGGIWQKISTDEEWTYQFLTFKPGDNVKLLLGSKESGAFMLTIDQ